MSVIQMPVVFRPQQHESGYFIFGKKVQIGGTIIMTSQEKNPSTTCQKSCVKPSYSTQCYSKTVKKKSFISIKFNQRWNFSRINYLSSEDISFHLKKVETTFPRATILGAYAMDKKFFNVYMTHIKQKEGQKRDENALD